MSTKSSSTSLQLLYYEGVSVFRTSRTMKLTFITVVLLIMLSCSNVNARAFRRSCGKYLADRISDLCKARGGYNHPSSRHDVLQTHHRVKRGVVDECCKQSCTDATLIQYCMNQAEEPEVVINFDVESTTQAPTEKSVEQFKFTTRFPLQAIPMEIGTVRPEFSRINAKYLGNRRKQYYYYY